MARALTIGQAAKATGIAAKTIRYYEQVGVLPTPRRTASGYRQYDEPAVEHIRFIGRARALGLPLQDVKGLAVALDGRSGPALRPRLSALVREQLGAVEERIRHLETLKRRLQEISARLLTTPGRRQPGPCCCLEPGDAAGSVRGSGGLPPLTRS
jgi:DNA-binding transcriptional MerR regulator